MAKAGICSIDGCGKPDKARGWCASHWWRWKNHGAPLGGRAHARGDVLRYLNETVMQYEGDDCLVWPFYRTQQGYGQIRLDGRQKTVSRVVCESANGPPPSEKHEAAHTCGNGRGGCVSKRHLVWKTHAENMADMSMHGTSQKGEKAKGAKLTAKDVAKIRQLASNMSQTDIARIYSVTQSAVCKIVSRRNWAHIS